jgi:hypothetical protein
MLPILTNEDFDKKNMILIIYLFSINIKVADTTTFH